ncbi:MAG: LysR family transcriptional regulator [Chromatiales bacterium]|jgi:LysR family transcriptional regulator for metE and metH|nr:LysR family transcriptional regulator [Chromatiales bacterium]MDX9766984.1 LysR family transcriptional regulator [Ectothiorhodospiraceae bacterium]
MIELRHLRSLTALRDSGSLTAAAERLHLTQSALSHQLAELEQRLDMKLFERKSRPPRFTLAGERLLALAEDLLPRLREAERDLARLRGGHSGRLHVTVECHSCFEWLMPALETFRGYWPEVTLDLSMGYGFEPLPALARGDVDLVVTADPVEHAGIVYEPLFRYQNVLLMPPGHALCNKPWIAPVDLAGETVISYPVEPERLDLFRRFLAPAGVEVTRRSSELTVMILQLVASGRGLAALPQWAAASAAADGHVVTRPLGEHGLWSTLYAAVREEQRELAYVAEFIGTAKASCFATLEGLRAATA